MPEISGLHRAATGRLEIVFWPALASGYLFSMLESNAYLEYSVVLALIAAISYTGSRTRDVFQKDLKYTALKRVKRQNPELEYLRNIVRENRFPSATEALKVAASTKGTIIGLINIILILASAYLWYELWSFLVYQEQEFLGVLVLLAPILYLGAFLWLLPHIVGRLLYAN